MFLEIKANSFISFDGISEESYELEILVDTIYINSNAISQVTLQRCAIDQFVNGQKVSLNQQIQFDSFNEYGAHRVLTLFYQNESEKELIKLKEKLLK